MKKLLLSILLLLPFTGTVAFASENESPASTAVEINSFWSNWFVQTGIDLSFQNPYGHKFSLSNGKSWGIDAAVGKWFTPALGLRGKLNWENGIPLFGTNKSKYLAPFDQPGRNMKKGGYVTMVGDVILDAQNLFYPYRADRFWDFYAFFRAGGLYNFGVSKGSPLLGLGLGSTFRVNDKIKIYCDMAYQWVSSGHVGVEIVTGTGSNSNGFFDFNVGVQFNLGNSTFKPVTK